MVSINILVESIFQYLTPDQGLLKLDDPVVKYVPELREVHDPYGDISEITIRHLLSHTAGFRAATWPWGPDKDWHPFEPTRWEQLVAMMPYTEVEFKPGSKFSYSNLGVIFLGRIIEYISHDFYQAYIDKNIFKPLEMYRSYFDHPPYHLLKYRAHSYRVREGAHPSRVRCGHRHYGLERRSQRAAHGHGQVRQFSDGRSTET